MELNKSKKSFEENDLYVKFYEEIAKNYLYGNKSQKLSDIYDAEKVIKFKPKKIVGIDCSKLIWGFGAVHCMTQQEPKV